MTVERLPVENPKWTPALLELISIGIAVLNQLDGGVSLFDAALSAQCSSIIEAKMAAEIAMGDEFGLLEYTSKGKGVVDSEDAAVLCAGIIDWKWVDERSARLQSRRAA